MKKTILITGLIFVVITVMVFLIQPIGITFIAFFQMRDIQHLEKRMCSPEYYEPVAKDLAVICSNIKTTITMHDPPDDWYDLNNLNDPNRVWFPNAPNVVIWWPDSVKRVTTFDHFSGSLASDGACVFFTGGFTHLSYWLYKIHNDNESSDQWELYFQDEGRKKYLTTVELSGDELFSFKKMLEVAIKEYELEVKENPDRIEQLEDDKNVFFSLFNKSIDDQFTE